MKPQFLASALPYPPRTEAAARVGMVWLLLMGAACSPAPSGQCGPDSCAGCCDAQGVCQPGDSMASCGVNGLACDSCVTAQICGAGRCVATGAGGGSGVGGGGGSVSCASPLVACGAACVDTRSDPNHCGTCSTVCTSGCGGGQCQTLPADCTTSPCPALGYYCDLSSKQCKSGCVQDAQCSGALGKCDLATRSCGCVPGSCGATNYCTAARTCAPGCEQTTQCSGQINTCNTTSHQCVCSDGSCANGSFCGADGSCAQGCGSDNQCTAANENSCNLSSHLCECNPGAHKCGGACVSNQSLNACGNNCTPCPAPPAHATASCSGGACGFACAPFYFRVGSGCYPMQTVGATYSTNQEIKCRIDTSSFIVSCDTFILNGLSDAAYVVGDYDVICALRSTGTVSCAGRSNEEGELGVGTSTTSSPVFLTLPNLPTNLVKIGFTGQRGFALTATGELWRWGGGFPISSVSTSYAVQPAPTPVPFRTGIRDVGVGTRVVCTISNGTPGKITCEGNANSGNAVYATTAYSAPAGVVLEKVAYASEHGCAIDTLGNVYCFGSGAPTGQLGFASTSLSELPLTRVPNFPPAGTRAIAVAVTSVNNSCAVLDNGRLYCWGLMGNGNVATPTPTLMPGGGYTNVGANSAVVCPSDQAYCIDP